MYIHPDSVGILPPTPDLKTLIFCEIQRDLSGGDRLNQHYVKSFGKGLNVTKVHLYIKVPHCRFKGKF